MTEADQDKSRNREIAENEAERQTVSDIRVSTWAIAVAVVIGLAAVGWVLLHRQIAREPSREASHAKPHT